MLFKVHQKEPLPPPGNLALLLAPSHPAFPRQGHSLNPVLHGQQKICRYLGKAWMVTTVTVDRAQAQRTFNHTQQLNLLEGLQAPEKVVKVKAGLNPQVSILFRSSGAILGQSAANTQIYYPEFPRATAWPHVTPALRILTSEAISRWP